MRHQQLGREIAKYQDRYAFFYDTRTGKTPLSLAIMYDDIVANPSHKWLVVCPLILIDNAWLPDAAEFVPEITTISCHATTPAKRIERINSNSYQPSFFRFSFAIALNFFSKSVNFTYR